MGRLLKVLKSTKVFDTMIVFSTSTKGVNKKCKVELAKDWS